MISKIGMKILTAYSKSTGFRLQEVLDVILVDWQARHVAEERHLTGACEGDSFEVGPFVTCGGSPVLGLPLYDHLSAEYDKLIGLQMDRIKSLNLSLSRLQSVLKDHHIPMPVAPEIVSDLDDEEDSERKLDS